MKREISVTLEAKDWRDLVNFVGGDLANMDQACEIAQQMKRICEKISLRVAKGDSPS